MIENYGPKIHPRGVIWVPSNSPHDVRLNWSSGTRSLSSSKACPWVLQLICYNSNSKKIYFHHFSHQIYGSRKPKLIMVLRKNMYESNLNLQGLKRTIFVKITACIKRTVSYLQFVAASRSKLCQLISMFCPVGTSMSQVMLSPSS